MTKIDHQTEVEIVLDSISMAGSRLTTFKLTYPRFIHSEFMTHRIFSRNASSSRAVPVQKMLDAIQLAPVFPTFGSNQRGMQAGEPLQGADLEDARASWLRARDAVLREADHLRTIGVHKQDANRLLEPFATITVVATATNLERTTFFPLRAHPLAQPQFQVLACAMRDAYTKSEPQSLISGEWHMPFIRVPEVLKFTQMQCLKMSVARCARTSYLNFDGKNSPEEDMALFDRLANPGKDSPLHASPMEHQAEALDDPTERSGNFQGFRQFRQLLEKKIIP